MAEELKKGNVDVADMFTTTSAIGRNQLVQLEDPKQLILPQNVIPLVRAEVAENKTATAALDAVQAALTTEDLIALNSKVDDDRQDADQVAKEWLTSKGLA
jgi:osmoprotectant transport system substrate-binding protein